jgi:hypothetical protein
MALQNIFAPFALFFLDDGPAALIDASNLLSPFPLQDLQGFYFFGQTAPTVDPDLSLQWLTAIVAAPDEASANAALAEAVHYVSVNNPSTPQLELSLDYHCTEAGQDTRLVSEGLPDLSQTWSYIVVDSAPGPNNTMIAKEIWISTTETLTPAKVDGKALLGPGANNRTIDGAALAASIAANKPCP